MISGCDVIGSMTAFQAVREGPSPSIRSKRKKCINKLKFISGWQHLLTSDLEKEVKSGSEEETENLSEFREIFYDKGLQQAYFRNSTTLVTLSDIDKRMFKFQLV